jgi:hypothetical protein
LRSLRNAVLAVAFVLAGVCDARAAWNNAGVFIRSVYDAQIDQPLIPDFAGGVYVPSWDGLGFNGYQDGFLAHFDHGGDAVWPERALSYAYGGVGAVPDGAGGVIVACGGADTIRVLRFAPDGNLESGWPAGGVSTGLQGHATPQVLGLPDEAGGMFVFNGVDALAEHRDGTGASVSGWPVALPRSGAGISPRAARDSNGGLYVWSPTYFPGDSLYLFHAAADGSIPPGWSSGGAAVAAHPDFFPGGLVADPSGGVFVVWRRHPVGWYDTPHPFAFMPCSLMVQHFTVSGGIAPGLPAEGRVITAVTDTALTTPEAVSDGAGGLYVTWGLVSAQGTGIHTVRLGGDGLPASGWPAGGIDMLPPGTPYAPPGDRAFGFYYFIRMGQGFTTAADGGGGLFIAWRDSLPGNTTVALQRVQSDGTRAPGWPASGALAHDATGAGGEVTGLVPDGAGGAFVAWHHVTLWPMATVVRSASIENPHENSDFYLNRVGPSGVVAALASLASASIDGSVARLSWLVSDGASRFTIERRVDAGAWARVAETSPDGRGFVSYDDPVPAGASTLAYRLAWTESGTAVSAGEVTLVVPHAARFALESLAPNPARDALTVRFALRSGTLAKLELIDVAGRRLRSESLEAGTGGERVLRLDGLDALPAGVYLARLSQGTERAFARVAVVK